VARRSPGAGYPHDRGVADAIAPAVDAQMIKAIPTGLILLIGRRRLDAETWKMLRLVCGGWWIGWSSATIARIGYPPPRPLTPEGERRLRIISSVLVALGLANTVRMLAAGKRPPDGTRARVQLTSSH
jgi:hypothetical protein